MSNLNQAVIDTHAIKEQVNVRARQALLKNIFTLAAILLAGVLFWIIIEVFFLSPPSTLPTTVVSASRRLDASLNGDVLTTIAAKRSYHLNELAAFPIFLAPDDSGTGRNASLSLYEKSPVRPLIIPLQQAAATISAAPIDNPADEQILSLPVEAAASPAALPLR